MSDQVTDRVTDHATARLPHELIWWRTHGYARYIDVDIGNGYAFYIRGCVLLNRNFENILYRVHNMLLGYLVICIESTKTSRKNNFGKMSFLRLGTKLTTTPLYFLTVLRGKVQ